MPNFRPHNQKAFREINDMLDKYNRCIYVSATGTEKSLVAAVTFQTRSCRHPLVLAPSRDILRQWKKYCPEVSVMTYQKFCHLEAADIVPLYDFIILDEVHHADSPVWGQPVRDILQNTDIPVLGLTATPRRYSDGGKDVSESLFDNHRVDGPGPGEAIASGILPGFLYVSALFGLEDVVKECKEQNLSPSLVSKLEFCIHNTGTVIDVLHRDMPQGKRKAVVFCEDINSIPEAVRVLKDAYPQQRIWVAHSLMKKGERFSAVSEFAAAEEGFIVTVDIFNEGMHVDGVNTGIMFRRTQSPTIYIQQMGRCLTPGNQDVVFFDFVGNCASARDFDEKRIAGESALSTYFGVGPQKEELPSEIIVKSYIAQSLEILQRIKELLSGRWTEEMIAFLKEHYQKDGAAYCAEKLGKTVSACQKMAHNLGFTRKNTKWTAENIEFLRKNYPLHGAAYCAEKLGKTVENCRTTFRNLGSKSGPSRNIPRWTEEEIEFLHKNYRLHGPVYCAEKLGRTVKACKHMARKLSLVYKKPKWTEKDIEFLCKNYMSHGVDYCAEKLGRTVWACRSMAHKLGLSNPTKWTEEDIEFLRQNYVLHGSAYCAEKLGRTVVACKYKAQKLGLAKSAKWTKEEIEFLHQNYMLYGGAYCAQKLGRTKRSCQMKAQRLGLVQNASNGQKKKLPAVGEDLVLSLGGEPLHDAGRCSATGKIGGVQGCG